MSMAILPVETVILEDERVISWHSIMQGIIIGLNDDKVYDNILI